MLKADSLFEAEDEIDCGDEEQAGYEMIPTQGHVEGNCGEEHKDHQRDHFLNHFELH